jgi:hypothetical protein
MEEWRDVAGYEGKYQVSNMGRVKSVARMVKRAKATSACHPINERIRKQATDKKGYKRVGLMKDGKLVTEKVHRLVSIAFIPNPHNLPQVNHINGAKDDNRAENLEWADNSKNQIHAYKKGLNYNKKGSESNRATLTVKQVEHIRSLKYYRGLYAEYGRKYNVDATTISNVFNKKYYRGQ